MILPRHDCPLLPPEANRRLKEIGCTKGLEFANIARHSAYVDGDWPLCVFAHTRFRAEFEHALRYAILRFICADLATDFERSFIKVNANRSE